MCNRCLPARHFQCFQFIRRLCILTFYMLFTRYVPHYTDKDSKSYLIMAILHVDNKHYGACLLYIIYVELFLHVICLFHKTLCTKTHNTGNKVIKLTPYTHILASRAKILLKSLLKHCEINVCKNIIFLVISESYMLWNMWYRSAQQVFYVCRDFCV